MARMMILSADLSTANRLGRGESSADNFHRSDATPQLTFSSFLSAAGIS
jgi:hypothetical protein